MLSFNCLILITLRGQGIGAEADPVGEEDFFEGADLVGFVGGGGSLFPGIPGFGIPDSEGQVVAGAIQEFIGFGGLGGAVHAAGLKFLNLLHIE